MSDKLGTSYVLHRMPPYIVSLEPVRQSVFWKTLWRLVSQSYIWLFCSKGAKKPRFVATTKITLLFKLNAYCTRVLRIARVVFFYTKPPDAAGRWYPQIPRQASNMSDKLGISHVFSIALVLDSTAG